MNFVDTAITLLHEFGRAMAVDELCKLALERDLLDKPGADPLRSLKTRLTVELKKGRLSRVKRDADEAWLLREGVGIPEGAKPAAKAKKATAKAPAAKVKKSTAKAPTAKVKKSTAKAPTAKVKKSTAKAPTAKVKKSTAKAPAAKVKKSTAKAPTAKTRATIKTKTKTRIETSPSEDVGIDALAEGQPKIKRARRSRTKPDTAQSNTEIKTEVQTKIEEVSARNGAEKEVEVVLTEEEQALVKLYGSGSEGTLSASELNEYKDALTKDEDRLMLPEIKAERRPYRRDRTRKRRTRPERPERSSRSRQEQGESRRSPGRPKHDAPRDIAGAPLAVADADCSPSEELTAAAHVVLAELPAGQSMPVRQLTQALIRNGNLEGKADALWRMVKGTLLVSEQRRTTRGLIPFVLYRGKDLFSTGERGGRSAVSLAQAALSRAADNYAAAVEEEMRSRIAQLAPSMLERIAYVYLQTTGWTGISWIKTVENSSYALATAPGAVDQTLVAVRCGPGAIDRRGVGELRAGLHAKNLDSGLLLSPCALSDEADTELAKEGAYVRVLCSRDFVSDLIAREVGVTWCHQQLPQIDQRFWDALLG